MKYKKVLMLLAVTVALSGTLSACSFGGDDAGDQVVVETTPTPEVTEAPDPTPTTAPADAQNTTYKSKDKSVSVTVPDATWANKTDGDDMISFESPEQGKLLILHGAGDEAMSVAVIPTTPDTAVALEQASDLEQGTDFVIHDYTSTDINGIGVYSYTVEYLNDKSEYAYVVNKYFANDNEFYSITGSVKSKDDKVLKKVKKSVESFTITGDSSLKSAASGSSDSKSTDAQGTDGQAADNQTSDTQGTAEQGGADSSTDSSAGSSNGGYSEDALSDTNQTRTLYRNSDGHAFVVYADGNGNWVDDSGNTYDFVNDEDVYDQDGVDYYYHGEAADVYYMPVE